MVPNFDVDYYSFYYKLLKFIDSAGTFGVEKKVAGNDIWGRYKDGGRLLIYLLDCTHDLAVGV